MNTPDRQSVQHKKISHNQTGNKGLALYAKTKKKRPGDQDYIIFHHKQKFRVTASSEKILIYFQEIKSRNMEYEQKAAHGSHIFRLKQPGKVSVTHQTRQEQAGKHRTGVQQADGKFHELVLFSVHSYTNWFSYIFCKYHTMTIRHSHYNMKMSYCN